MQAKSGSCTPQQRLDDVIVDIKVLKPKKRYTEKLTLDQDSTDRKPLSALLVQNMTPQLLKTELTDLDVRSQNFCTTLEIKLLKEKYRKSKQRVNTPLITSNFDLPTGKKFFMT